MIIVLLIIAGGAYYYFSENGGIELNGNGGNNNGGNDGNTTEAGATFAAPGEGTVMNYTYDDAGAGSDYDKTYVFAGYTNGVAGDNTVFKVTSTMKDAYKKTVSTESDSSPYADMISDNPVKTGTETLDTCDGSVTVDVYVCDGTDTYYVGQSDSGAKNLAVYKIKSAEMVMTLNSYDLTKGTNYTPTHSAYALKWTYEDGTDTHKTVILGETKDYLFIHIEDSAAYLYVSNDSSHKPMYAEDVGNKQVSYQGGSVTKQAYEYSLGYSAGNERVLTVFYDTGEASPLIVLTIKTGSSSSYIHLEITK